MTNSIFRSIEVSDPAFEANNLRFITVKTPHLRGRGDICVFVPPGIQTHANVPVVILLHGVYGSSWSWSHQGGVHLAALRLMEEGKIPPMIIAMPSDGLWGDGSAYLAHSAFNFEEWIVDDVPHALRLIFECIGDESPCFIGGLSMGGFGALRIGAKYADLFKGISAHSSITNLNQMPLFVEEHLSQFRQNEAVDEDVFQTLFANRDQLPSLRFDCGNEDLLIEHNRHLHQQLLREGIPHVYEEFEGGHEWPYWQKHVLSSLQFFATLI